MRVILKRERGSEREERHVEGELLLITVIDQTKTNPPTHLVLQLFLRHNQDTHVLVSWKKRK